MHPSCLGSGNLLPENMLRDGVHPFRTVQGSKPHARIRRHATLCLFRVPIGQVEGNKETCVRVNTQKRPRSSTTRSAPDTERFPNIFRRRLAKSGRSSGADCACAGTIRAITFWRSRSSTVWPALNNSFSRRVSRNWRIFTDCMVKLWHIMCHIASRICHPHERFAVPNGLLLKLRETTAYRRGN
jgi:hypothetical protein